MNYDLVAPVYDLGVWLAALPLGGEERLRAEVIALMRPLEGMRVLELFAGTSSLSMMAAKEGATAVALDKSAGMQGAAREKIRRQTGAVRLARGDASTLPFQTETFDRAVISLGLHETEAWSIPLVLAEAHRVLKKGGRLAIFDYYGADGAAGFIQRCFFAAFEGPSALVWIKMDVDAALREAGFRNFHRRFFAKRALQAITVEKI